MATALDKLKSAKTYLHPLLFVKSYEFDLGTDALVYFGAQQCVPPPLFPVNQSADTYLERSSPVKKPFCATHTS